MIHSLEYTGEQLNTILREAQTTKVKADNNETEIEKIKAEGFETKTQHNGNDITLFGLGKNGLTVASKESNNKITICKVVNQSNLAEGEIEIYLDKSTGKVLSKEKVRPNEIVMPGEPGAGMGIAEDEVIARLGLSKLEGTDNPNSENFGNYIQKSTGSIMVYIPKHYQKYTNITEAPYYGWRVDISREEKEGYFLPRVFINADAEVDGIFLDKYTNSLSLGWEVYGSIPVSIRNKPAIPSNQINRLKAGWEATGNSPGNDISYAIDCVKSRHPDAFVMPFSAYSMLNGISEACWQEAWRMANIDMTLDNITNICAWADMEPYRPRGAHNGNCDIHDRRVIFRANPYNTSNALVGGVEEETFAKITHNGQRCGFCIGGNIWEHAHGFYHTYVYKESCDIRTLTRNDCTAGQVPNNNKFEKINCDHVVGEPRWIGNNTTMPWEGSTNRTDDDYKRNALGQTKVRSSSTHRRYGERIYYNTNTGNQTCLYYGSWTQPSDGGPRNSNCGTVFAASSTDVSLRTALYP